NFEPLFWSAHWQRLERSFTYFTGKSLAGEKDVLKRLQKHWQQFPDTIVRLDLCADGSIELNSRALLCRDDEPGIKARFSSTALLPREFPYWLKAGDYSARFEEREKARGQGCDEIIFCDPQGRVCEATVSNLIWSDGEKFYTPKSSDFFLQ